MSGLVDRLAHALDALEDMGEDLVELVEMALVLHQAGAGEIVELLDALVGEIPVERLQQGQVFPQGDRHLGGAQLGEEGQEHRASVCNAARRSRGEGRGHAYRPASPAPPPLTGTTCRRVRRAGTRPDPDCASDCLFRRIALNSSRRSWIDAITRPMGRRYRSGPPRSAAGRPRWSPAPRRRRRARRAGSRAGRRGRGPRW